MIETVVVTVTGAWGFRFRVTWITLRFLTKVYDSGGPGHVQKVSAALAASGLVAARKHDCRRPTRPGRGSTG
ncbi:hypothetical protein FPZ12_005020 [Amycolatopsis acidicola]|uniref:Uncharacterized protein n=1 Tax=Amycolatopsis acidicola TaxID=2596893 RepID=A0A5N0VK17_9PSEU|nr:hypothetical protein [Amycolatopsis acidicola]KAA9165843.1 hypothetical protein FPZ12_005020 [Amycolatopsis acidicola]